MLKNCQAGAFLLGFFVSIIGGLVGLGGAEFRLPFLIKLFGFAPLEAVIINKVTSLVVVSSSLVSRTAVIPFSEMMKNLPVALNLLTGSILGAWLAADWATKVRAKVLQRVMAVVLLFIAIVLVLERSFPLLRLDLPSILLYPVGALAGFLIGVVAALLGVAGGELLIPTITLLYHLDVKLAGSMSLLVSLPTMLFAFARYSRDRSFLVLREKVRFMLFMVFGSLLGSFLGGSLLLEVIPQEGILMLLVLILLISSYKLLKH